MIPAGRAAGRSPLLDSSPCWHMFVQQIAHL